MRRWLWTMALDHDFEAKGASQFEGVSAGEEPGLPGGAPAETRRDRRGGPLTFEAIRALNPSRSMARRYTPEERFRVLEAYRASGLTQRAFAEATGLSTSTLGVWARGASRRSAGARKRVRHFTPEERRRTVEAFGSAGLPRKDCARVNALRFCFRACARGAVWALDASQMARRGRFVSACAGGVVGGREVGSVVGSVVGSGVRCDEASSASSLHAEHQLAHELVTDALPGRALHVEVLRDPATRRVWCTQLQSSPTAERAAAWLEAEIARVGYAPLVLSTDNGPAYTSEVFGEFLRRHAIVHLCNLPRTPQPNMDRRTRSAL